MQEARRRPTRRNPREVHAAERAARLSPQTSGLGPVKLGAAVLRMACTNLASPQQPAGSESDTLIDRPPTVVLMLKGRPLPVRLWLAYRRT